MKSSEWIAAGTSPQAVESLSKQSGCLEDVSLTVRCRALSQITYCKNQERVFVGRLATSL